MVNWNGRMKHLCDMTKSIATSGVSIYSSQYDQDWLELVEKQCWLWINATILCLWQLYEYLESVLELHHAAVEEGRGKLRGDAQNFGYSPTGLSRNRVSAPKRCVIGVHYPLRLSRKGLLLTQVEIGGYCARWLIEYFNRDPQRLTYLHSGEKKTFIINISVKAVQKNVFSV